MDAGQLLREARWSSGLSQRALASRAAVSRRVVEAAESGKLAPRADVLDALLRACGAELASRRVPTADVNEEVLRAHLTLSLSRRLCIAGGGAGSSSSWQGSEAWTALRQLAAAEGEIAACEGPLALAAWLPGQQLVAGQSITITRFRMGALARTSPFSLDVHVPPWSWELVRVRLPGTGRRHGGDLLVPPPFALLDDVPDRLAAGLHAAAEMLHDGGARDAAGRRTPAHARANEDRRNDDIRARYDGRSGRLPSVLDSPSWRLDAPGSVREDLELRGLRRYPPKAGWSRWGWR